MAGKRPHRAQFRCDDARHAAHRRGLLLAGLPRARDSVAEIESFDGVREIAHEIAPPQFAVGENLESKFLLLGEHAPDILILELSQPRGVRSRIAPRFQNFSGAQKTADMIGTVVSQP